MPSITVKQEATSRLLPQQDHDTRVSVLVVQVGQVSVARPLEQDGSVKMKKKPTGLYANIKAKRDRIESGSEERMRQPGAKGAPTAAAFRASALTAKKPKSKGKTK